jgi:hypothetical protein
VSLTRIAVIGASTAGEDDPREVRNPKPKIENLKSIVPVNRIPVVTLGSWRLEERELSHGMKPIPAKTAKTAEDAVKKALGLLRR